ncbi:3-dehydroquinate synthase [Helicobacter didelphidarum]|uniref:3-dehydroquinate synthase n=1 Tax=Helicobacter didelphidarum TaxID=2040648 RepID=A0A3D8IRA5_9HELI|nr:3-dehydroquinate synthase [Helicobacter didelphidarum]RDU67131.1 3-dehydroquinate synthase [Helicobacter didelphidarum]
MKSIIRVKTQSQNYEVIIDVLKHINFDTEVLLVTTQSVANIFLDNILTYIEANKVETCILPDGEEQKTLQTIEKILNKAFEVKLNRNSMMIALGGGVITDMVGFASGIYQRGIGFVSIPTTLLAMVDASVGGKCGVNNAYGKNLIGLFHQPKAVYIDLRFLETLPKREFNAGFAEIIKILACFDYSLLQDFHANQIETYIKRSIELKALIVQEDEQEKNGKRALLNYGHTFAHVIELEGRFSKYLHGEAVSMGIIMANTLSQKLGILSEEIALCIENLLKQCGLPTKYKIENIESFYQAFFLDKKSLDSKLHFVLLESTSIIQAKVHNTIPKETLFEVLYEFSK